MPKLSQNRPEKTAQELTGMMSQLIADNAREEAGMKDVRYVATPLLKIYSGECNWRAVIVSVATDEQLRIVEWAAVIVGADWNMLERRKTPRP